MAGKPPKAPTKRKGGSNRPAVRPAVRIIGAKQLREIERMLLDGLSTYAIAERLGVARETIDGHVERHIRPWWRQQAARSSDQLKAEVQRVKEENWKRYRKSPIVGLADVRWAVEQEAKLGGFYAAEKHEVSGAGEFRAAGQSPQEAAAAFLRKLVGMAVVLKTEARDGSVSGNS
jgi:hypothetical protein